MTIEDLEEKVESRLKILENTPYPEDPAYEKSKQFIKNNKIKTIEDFLNIDIYEAVKLLYYINQRPKCSFERCSEVVERTKAHIKNFESADISTIAEFVIQSSKMPNREIYFDYYNEPDINKRDEIFKKLDLTKVNLNGDPSDEKLVESFRELLEAMHEGQEEDLDIVSLIKAAAANKQLMGDMSSLIYCHKEMNEEYHAISFEALELHMGSKYIHDELSYFCRREYKIDMILSKLQDIPAFIALEDRNREKYNNRQKGEKTNALSVLYELKRQVENPEIKNANTLLRRIKDKELKRRFLVFIYEHNAKYYKALLKEYNKINENTIAQYQLELLKHKITIDSSEIINFTYNNFDDFKEIVYQIKKIFTKNKKIIWVLKNTNIEIVKTLISYLKREYVTESYLEQNYMLFGKDNEQYILLSRNIKMLEENNVNPKKFRDNSKILLRNDNLVEENIKIIVSYDLHNQFRLVKDASFILDPKLVEKIDKLIELGYRKLLENDLNILNGNIKRLELLHAMNIPVTSLNKINEIIFQEKFFVQDEDIDNYVPDDIAYEEKTQINITYKDLESKKYDKWSYIIGTQLISRNKVNRLLNQGLDMYDAIFYNLKLSAEDYDTMIKELTGENQFKKKG